jgi:DNA-binding NtrC family response regulator
MNPLYSLAVVDDEPTIREGIAMALGSTYEVRLFASAEEALALFGAAPPDMVLLDVGLPGMNGLEALGRIRALSPGSLVVMITAFEDVETVVTAMRQGAYDYVVKPLHMDNLRVIIRNGLETLRFQKEIHALQEESLKEIIPFFIGASQAIQGVMEFVEQVAPSPDTPVLIVGETGTGKELVASAIHYRSPNFRGELVTVNCAAIPRDLVESELFGYEEGAFSGAKVSGKKGLIDRAAHGTLFLDEVGDLSLEAQAKLLRFVEVLSGGRYQKGQDQYQGGVGHQPGSCGNDQQESVPAGLIFPAWGDPGGCPLPEPAAGGYPAAGGTFPGAI